MSSRIPKPLADPEGGGGGKGVRTPRGIARLLIFAMLKFSVRPFLGMWTPPPPPENFLDLRMEAKCYGD